MRKAAKVDANQPAIVAALRACGYWVQSLAAVGHGFPDLIAVSKGGRLMLLEVKMPGEHLTDDEAKWHANYPGPVAIVIDEQEAIAALDDLDK